MFIKVDPSSGLPIYLQIIEQVKLSIAAGSLHPGDQLPSVRQLGADLRVNPNTVAKAYNEMERDGVIHTRRGEGTFVSADEGNAIQSQRTQIMEKQVRELVETARKFNISKTEMVDLLERHYDGGRKER